MKRLIIGILIFALSASFLQVSYAEPIDGEENVLCRACNNLLTTVISSDLCKERGKKAADHQIPLSFGYSHWSGTR